MMRVSIVREVTQKKKKKKKEKSLYFYIWFKK